MQREQLKTRREYLEMADEASRLAGKGDYCRATFPFGRCANRTKHTNNASLSKKLAGPRKEKSKKRREVRA